MRRFYLFTTLILVLSGCIKERHLESPEYQALTNYQKQQVESYIHALQEVTFDPLGFTERWRPQYHLTPAFGSMDKPIRLLKVGEVWHLFFETGANAIGLKKGWGQAISKDLVHWKLLPVSIFPDSASALGSGAVVFDKTNSSGFSDELGGFVAVYKELNDSVDQVRIAYSKKGIYWSTYQKPIDIGSEIEVQDIFWHYTLNCWVLLGSYDNSTYVYHSKNLKQWKRKELLLENVSPDLFFFAQFPDDKRNAAKWVMRDSSMQYLVGTFDGSKFFPEGILASTNDLSEHVFASDTLSGKLYTVKKVINGSVSTEKTHPWEGAFALPKQVELWHDGNGRYRLKQTVVEKIESLQREKIEVPDWTASQEWNDLTDELILGNLLQVNMTIQTEKGAIVQLQVLKGENETVEVNYQEQHKLLRLIKKDLRTGAELLLDEQFIPNDSGKIALQLWLDVGVLEVIVQNGDAVLSAQVFPSPLSQVLRIRSEGADSYLTNLNAYQMYSFWKEEFYRIQRTIASKSHIELSKDESTFIEAGVFPYYLKADSFSWKVLDEKIATIQVAKSGDKIELKAKKIGRTKLVIDSYKGIPDTIPLQVNP